MNKHQNYAAFDNIPYITASHKAVLIVHVSVTVLLGIGRGWSKVTEEEARSILLGESNHSQTEQL